MVLNAGFLAILRTALGLCILHLGQMRTMYRWYVKENKTVYQMLPGGRIYPLAVYLELLLSLFLCCQVEEQVTGYR
ncbi:hypothetical protein GGS20DRAFT_570440 [Poronia punctata]|nr:hypothetical protein GGS20DRAFT_570440 [Poronia punctata]